MRILDTVDAETWWDVARRCDYATFFHTPLWQELGVSVMEGVRDISFEARLDDGARAVVPLLERPRALFRVFGECLSTFAGCYGGPIADRPLSPDERRRLYEAADRTRGRSLLNGNPLVQEHAHPRAFQVSEDTTHLLRLDVPFDQLVSRFSKGHRSSLAAGRASGVTIRRAEALDDYRRYFDLYEASLDRWGETATSAYPWTLFERGQALAARSPGNMALWLAEVDDAVVAGAWIFYWNRHAVYWHGAADEAGRRTSATTVLLADAIADAQRRGFNAFDFNPSGGHTSVAAFKRRFGAEAVRFSRYRRVHAPARQLVRGAALLAARRR